MDNKLITKIKNISDLMSTRLEEFNKYNNIIKVNSKYEFGFPHFVHTMEYFYYLSEIVISNKSKLIIIIKPLAEYKSNYVNNFFKVLLNKYNNFIFIEKDSLIYKYNKKYTFNHDEHQQEINFIYILSERKKKSLKGKILTWFRDRTISNKIRDMFFEKKSNNNIKIGLINRKTRRLNNENIICKKILDEFGLEVETTTFDNRSFMEQITFFNNHNIIISAHGAELCSIPFSPDNALIIECCSKGWSPYYYFSGLSFTSRKIHVVLSDNNDIFPRPFKKNYGKNKNEDITINPEKIIKAIKFYMENKLKLDEVYLI